MKSVKEMKVYKMAFQVSLDTYQLTESFPRDEQFGLVSQMRRAAVLICSNLVEGCYRGTTKEYLHFVYVARGSAAELDCQLDLSKALGFVREPFAQKLKNNIGEILKMLSGLISKLTSLSTNHYPLTTGV